MSAKFTNDPDFNDVIPKPKNRRGISFAAVLAALGILVLLTALVIPGGRSARPAARRAQCMNNLKQIALALHNYEEAYKALPPAYTVDAQGRRLHSWRTLILPYLEQEALYKTIDLSKSWNDPANAKALETALAAFRCPEAAGPQNTTTYQAIVGPNACFPSKGSRRWAEITDPHDSTLMVIEAGEENRVPWMAPFDADASLVMSLGPTTQFHHKGGTNACFVSGRVLFLKASTSGQVRQALLSIAGKDNDVALDW
jgi:type II secretory pathway pseudopilin PulG